MSNFRISFGVGTILVLVAVWYFFLRRVEPKKKKISLQNDPSAISSVVAAASADVDLSRMQRSVVSRQDLD